MDIVQALIYSKTYGYIPLLPFLSIGQKLKLLTTSNILMLPRHPFESFGYSSLGCTHCTMKGPVEKVAGLELEKPSVVYT